MNNENCKVHIVSRQNTNPNGVTATEYKELRVVQDPLDETLLDLMAIQGIKVQRWRRS
jgi:hypothetical protein